MTLIISAASAIIFPCGVSVSTALPCEQTAARNIGERHALADAVTRLRRVALSEHLSPFEGNQGASQVAIEDEGSTELVTEGVRLFQKRPYLDRRPSTGRRRLKWRQRYVDGEQG